MRVLRFVGAVVLCVGWVTGCRELVSPGDRVGADDGTFNEFWFRYPDGSPIAGVLVEVDDVSYLRPGQSRSRWARHTDDEGLIWVPRASADYVDLLLRPEAGTGLHRFLYLGLPTQATRRELTFPGVWVDVRIVLPEGLQLPDIDEDDLEFERNVPWPAHSEHYELDFKLPVDPEGRYEGYLAEGTWYVDFYENWVGPGITRMQWVWPSTVVDESTTSIDLVVDAKAYDVTWEPPPDARTTEDVVLVSSGTNFIRSTVSALAGEARIWIVDSRTFGLYDGAPLELHSFEVPAEERPEGEYDFGSLGDHEIEVRVTRSGAPYSGINVGARDERRLLTATTEASGRAWIWIFGDASTLQWMHPDTGSMAYRQLDLTNETSITIEIDLDEEAARQP